MSGTTLQANGAVYGNGVYFSDSYSMSLSYSSLKSGNFCSNHFAQCVGVFEILTDPSNYKKTTNIFVIPDEKILLLRNLIVSKYNNDRKNNSNITNYFIKDVPMQKVINTGNIIMLKNKRLNSEYKKLLSETFIFKINIINGTNWIVDFNHISDKLIQIELIFSNYPLVPPVIKIITDINIDGLVNSNKEIQIDLINPANWKITNNLKEICEYIYNCIVNSI